MACESCKKKRSSTTTKTVHFIQHQLSGNWLTSSGAWTKDTLRALAFDDALSATKYAMDNKIRGWKLKEHRI